ncbi:MAG: divalent-cation tolerance protein CutA [Candidatus Omnitrophica bacterium]|nr:divalent-cation tolerance protein CutA [Candidatus Omnitrophota bacterium]
MTQGAVVLVTCPNRTVARRLGKALVQRRLAACVNLLPAVESVFWWRGRVDTSREVLLLIKTTRRLLPRLARAVVELHPYDLPEVLALPVAAGHPPYLRWVASSVLAR